MSRAIYDKAIYHRLQQMDRAVYDRSRNVLPTSDDGGDDQEDHGSIQPSNQDWYYLDSVEIVNAGSGFEANTTFTTEFFDAGAKSDNTPTVEITSVNDSGAITGISVSSGGLVALSENDNTLPLTVALEPESESGTQAVIACNWKPYVIQLSIPEMEWTGGYPISAVELLTYAPEGGFGYTADPDSNTLRFEIDNGSEDLVNPVITFTVTDGVLSNPVITESGVLGALLSDLSPYESIEVIIPGNPGKGALLYIQESEDNQ